MGFGVPLMLIEGRLGVGISTGIWRSRELIAGF